MPKAQILVIEDDAVVAKDIQNRLMDMGYSCYNATAFGEAAIKKVEEYRPDLVLMDIVLKGEMDGIEAAEVIQSRFGIPVVFLTAYADEERLERAKQTMPFGYILKPFRDRELMIAIEMARYTAKINAERRLAEQTLQKSEEKHRSLVESTGDCIYMVDRNGTYLFANETYLSRIGLTLDKFVGNTCRDLLSPDASKNFQEKINEVFETGRPLVYEHESERDGGCFLRTLSPIRESNGKTSAVTVISKDITERKRIEKDLIKSEHDYRHLVESTADWVWACDSEGRQTFTNTAVKKILGYEAHEITGVLSDSLMHPEDAKRTQTWFKKSVEEKKGWKNTVLRWKHKDGGVRVLESTAEPILDSKGNLNGFIGIDRDITERLQAETDLKKSREQLQHLSSQLIQAQEEERKRISLELHDEMGQALTAIELSLAEIEDELPPDLDTQIKNKFEEIHSIVSRSSEQISQLSLDLRPSMLDDLGLVPTLRWHFSDVAKRRRIKIDFKYVMPKKRLDTEIETVLYRISQESLNNIVKHADAKHVMVHLEHKKKIISLVIEDDGKGFDVNEVLKNPEKDNIGLVGMQERAKIIGANLHITSREGHRTRVFVEIPVGIDD